MRERNATQRMSAAPAWNKLGNIYKLPANAVAGTAESLLAALRASADAAGLQLSEGRISGFLISTKHQGSAVAYLRTDNVLGAAAAGEGIGIAADSTIYLPYPLHTDADFLYECSTDCFCAVFY